jgi:hypothetical protein
MTQTLSLCGKALRGRLNEDFDCPLFYKTCCKISKLSKTFWSNLFPHAERWYYDNLRDRWAVSCSYLETTDTKIGSSGMVLSKVLCSQTYCERVGYYVEEEKVPNMIPDREVTKLQVGYTKSQRLESWKGQRELENQHRNLPAERSWNIIKFQFLFSIL